MQQNNAYMTSKKLKPQWPAELKNRNKKTTYYLHHKQNTWGIEIMALNLSADGVGVNSKEKTNRCSGKKPISLVNPGPMKFAPPISGPMF